MTHFGIEANTGVGTDQDFAAWLPIGAQIGRLVNEWSFRNDLVVHMSGEQYFEGMVAAFNPASAEIAINTQKAFGTLTPEQVGNFGNRQTQLDNPAASGAIFHEAMHARFSRYSLESAHKVLTQPEFEALHLLEESRIESLGVRVSPDNRALLRAAAIDLVIGAYDPTTTTNISKAAFTAGLVLARVDAGILDEREVADIRAILVSVLGEETLAKLREVWLEVQSCEEHTNIEPFCELARRWVKILEEASAEAGEEYGEGESGEGESGEGGISATLGKLLEELGDVVKIATQNAIYDLMDKEEDKQEAKSREQAAKESRERQAIAKKVFKERDLNDPTAGTGTRSRLEETRKPTTDERIAAVKVSQMLERAKYRERSQTEIRSVIPQGRLRTRAMVQNAAYKSMGLNHRVEAWERTLRRHTDDPTLKIGVMVDISGSMGAAMQPMATTAWVLSEAGRRVQAQNAMVYFGQDVFATLSPGQHLENVAVYTASDHTEKFEKAFQALEGALNLLDSGGARLLVVVSDGQYVPDERRKAESWLKVCEQKGVAVVWVSDDKPVFLNYPASTRLVNMRECRGVADLAEAIGKQAAEALTRVGQRNG